LIADDPMRSCRQRNAVIFGPRSPVVLVVDARKSRLGAGTS
jgi:hypothetical protein